MTCMIAVRWLSIDFYFPHWQHNKMYNMYMKRNISSWIFDENQPTTKWCWNVYQPLVASSFGIELSSCSRFGRAVVDLSVDFEVTVRYKGSPVVSERPKRTWFIRSTPIRLPHCYIITQRRVRVRPRNPCGFERTYVHCTDATGKSNCFRDSESSEHKLLKSSEMIHPSTYFSL